MHDIQAMALMKRYARLKDLTRDEIDCILDCTVAAEEHGLLPMLVLCEAIITKQFPEFDKQDQQLVASKISAASMMKIAQSWNDHQQNIINGLHKALFANFSEAVTLCLRSMGNELMASNSSTIVCSRCQGTLHLHNGTMQHKASHGSETCDRPRPTHVQQDNSIKSIIDDMAARHSISVNSLGVL